MNSTTKNILIILGVAALAIAAYAIFARPDAGFESDPLATTEFDTTLAGTASDGGSSYVGNSFLTTLLSVRTLRLDDSLFVNPAFQNLKDFTIVLTQPGNEGRPNPFAPIAGIGAQTADPDGIGTGNDFLGN